MSTIDKPHPVEGSVVWLPGWYASRLHAYPENKELPIEYATAHSICGAFIYGKAPTDWAQRKIDKGVPRCKKCEKILAT